MWITKNVNLPEPLIEAQSDGKLVVFAGAGVSIGPPANLPGFSELFNKVAGVAPESVITESFDRFLGRLDERGVAVHRRTQEIIGNADSQPTPLHRDLLSLFQSPPNVRLITTNFDRHFSTASKQLYQESIEVYYAPALPLGREFHGLAYLHGSVDKPAETLVLTDTDFGRAYITDGWATRFLQEVFAEYTVLFLGYSHDDTVLSYLARALMPGTSRYVLTPSGRADHWSLLGIVPVTYPISQKPDGHRELGEAIQGWIDLAKMGALDHQRRTREIVGSRPPVEPEESDYIDGSLDDRMRVRFFTQHAQSLEWLNWVENKEVFRSLFQSNYPVGEVAQELGRWFARNFVCDHADTALGVVQRVGQQLNPVLWQAITAELAFREPRPEATALSKWVTVLLSSLPSEPQSADLSNLIARCEYPDDAVVALLLFESLTRPRLRLKPDLGYILPGNEEAERTGVEVETVGDTYWTAKAWKELFMPNLADFSERLESILTNHLIQAHSLLRAFNRADERMDAPSLSRSAVEPHEQNRQGAELSVLIDGARDVIEWILAHDAGRAQQVIEHWGTSGVPLLKRLATHGIAEATHIPSDRKIEWILDRDWLYAIGLKHEVFRLLAVAYPEASQSVRLRLLERVTAGPRGPGTENLEEQTREYEIYNALVWLVQAAPDCLLATQRLEDVKRARPEFEPREHPDLSHWTSRLWTGSSSPWTTEELLERNPHEEIDVFLTYEGEGFIGPDREGLLSSIARAVSQDFEWSWRLAGVLRERQEWASDIWNSILSGWRSSSFTEAQWKDVLALLDDNSQFSSHAPAVFGLPKWSLEAGQRDRLPTSFVPIAERIAVKLWDTYTKSEGLGGSGGPDWLGVAINHPGGVVAQFWILALSKVRTDLGEDWSGLPTRYQEYFAKILAETSDAGELGRVVLASELQFLFALDLDWALENILPLFDWSLDDRQAQQGWGGFLGSGRANEALLAYLLPLYTQGFSKLSTRLSSMRDEFCQHLASIAIYSSVNPIDDGWLRSFISEADSESRTTWARALGHQLSFLQSNQIQEIWDRWLARYWADRNSGVPLPLSAEEKHEMLLWGIELKPMFPEFVEKITAGDVGSPLRPSLYRRLTKEDFADTRPAALAKLLHHLLSRTAEGFHECADVGQLFRRLANSAVQPPELLEICDELARLGCPKVDELVGLIEERRSDV